MNHYFIKLYYQILANKDVLQRKPQNRQKGIYFVQKQGQGLY